MVFKILGLLCWICHYQLCFFFHRGFIFHDMKRNQILMGVIGYVSPVTTFPFSPFEFDFPFDCLR
ncbi:hypothetical protein GLYMA_01G068900v4 [Glycine max]|uniref:Uncharacterized protein n=2 Tax=Glycine subgen. Soja TaxID=1462606 RepID=A0A0R0LEF1_SOYBN|nr:hypothetical protein JHK87_000734 [Glycine soja]KAG5068369.1 hypothetical protein JHK85_000746 [Glycine max]KAG5088114.1 hypothetical protein JHK86_000726 [Glycine max]KAH1161974.1 hypothetical protein GYH30_000727 [Glycine max]KRH75194.1 hypothetical protein GLYMA_01G068900v4 [Glycine max]